MFSLLLSSTTALACGGFFCNRVEPVEQTGESVIFGIDDSNVNVHVQVTYQGPADEFAWIVPTPQIPTLDVSTMSLFNALAAYTEPRFQLTVDDSGCKVDPPPIESGWTSSGGSGAGTLDTGSAGTPPPPVIVVSEQSIGPYDSVILTATDSDALLTWLGDNDYDIPADVGASLDPYVSAGSYFVALKLQSDKDVGDLAPIALSYPGDEASIPIQLTAVAAADDMRLKVYVLGDSRAVPKSYLHVTLNPAVFDWFNLSNPKYEEAITLAANEAGGHAFATDYSGSVQSMGPVFTPTMDALRTSLPQAPSPAEAMNLIIWSGLAGDEDLLSALEHLMPIPDSLSHLSPSTVYDCVACYPEMMANWDPQAFAIGFDEQILRPRELGQALLDTHPNVTRLQSSISPIEMTVDPTFVLNREMPQHVDNQWNASLKYHCAQGMYAEDAIRTLTLPDGRDVQLSPSREGDEWDQMAPLRNVYALTIEETSEQGEPSVLFDYSGDSQAELDDYHDHNDGIDDDAQADNQPDAVASNGPATQTTGCGCGQGGPGSAGPGSALGWVACWTLLRVRRRRTRV